MSEDTIRVRVARGEFRYDRNHYTRGDELDVHDDALKKHPRTLEQVDEDEDADSDQAAVSENHGDGDPDFEVDPEEVDPHPSEKTVGELEDRLEDVDDPGLLKAIRHLEEESDDRKGAKQAIDDRLSELEG